VQPVYRCVAGIDVHKKMLAVVVRQACGNEVVYAQRQFGTTQAEIGHLAAWLQHLHVSEVAMESTAQYWRPVWYGLEAHFQLHLTHPLKTRAPRGRKSDFRDARRLADRWCSGDLEDSFVPGAEQREWRFLTRTRVQLRTKIGVIRSQVEGLLEQGGIKLTAVVTDLFGVSGWAMLEGIGRGDTTIEELLGEARGALRNKKTQLAAALSGKLTPACRLLLRQHLAQVRLIRQQILEIDEAVAATMQHHLPSMLQLMRIPGVDRCAAEQLLAEIGARAAAFPSAEQFVSWVGVCPGRQESAGVNHSRRSAKGNRYLRRLLCQIAWAAIHTKGTFFAGLFARLKPRLEGKGAAWAVAHRIGKVVWLVLHEGAEYEEKGTAPANPKILLRKMHRLLRQFAAQGLDPKKLLAQLDGEQSSAAIA
jgi:transposase